MIYQLVYNFPKIIVTAAPLSDAAMQLTMNTSSKITLNACMFIYRYTG